ncbi:MAG: NADH-quinone oxidoreductase subunit J, partial [Phycisphaeraceae bacterium]
MHTPIAIYIASFLGAVGLVLMMPKARHNYRLLGALIAAAALGGLWLFLGSVDALWAEDLGIGATAFGYHYLFGAIAIVSAARVITHTRPVYAALWFVLVVLASAGLLLTLAADFMAFAMIIIYAGAILVTYMFVIMLATQSAGGRDGAGGGGGAAPHPPPPPPPDRNPPEPVGAAAAGFQV